MDIWGWIVAYAVGLTVLQLLVYRYLLNGGGSVRRRVGTPSGDGERETSWPKGSSGASGSKHDDGPTDSQDSVPTPVPGTSMWSETQFRARGEVPGATADGEQQCPHCGTENERDEAFTRCWNCVGAL